MLCEDCKYYKEGNCADPKDFEDEYGEPCCRYMEGAQLVKQCCNAVVFDIDGTLADISSLLPLWDTDRDQFFLRLGEAKLYKDVCDVWYQFAKDFNIYIYTCRPEKVRAVTEEWLNKFKIDGILLMRADNDDRPDEDIKLDMLKKEGLSPSNVLFIMEDRTSIVRSLRDQGYRVLQCRNNDY